MIAQLQVEGRSPGIAGEKAQLERAMWDDDGHRIVATVAQPAPKLAAAAGFTIPDDRTFIIVEEDEIGRDHRFSGEKLTTLLAAYRYHGFDDALDKVRRIYEVAGKGHSCGIFSYDDQHIDASPASPR